jgi:hypothetical protein
MGNSSALPRSIYGITGQYSSPQSLAAYSLNRQTPGRPGYVCKNPYSPVDTIPRIHVEHNAANYLFG